MTKNIMNEYIEITRVQINEYMKLVFENEFNERYCELFVERYINIRYFNYYENNVVDTMRRRIIEQLKEVGEDIIINNINDRVLIEKMKIFFYYVLYFDNVIYCNDLKKKIAQIEKVKKKTFEQEIVGFQEKLYRVLEESTKQKEELIKKFSSDEFFIKLTTYPNKLKVYRVNLKYSNIKFPLEYSEFVINKAFQTGIVNEDRLMIEYYLIVLQILKDILKLDFKRKYILEFAHTMLKKPMKLKRLLNIISNEAVQERVSLKIKYEHFMKNKEVVYELMREGYKITVILDNSFEADFRNIESLHMFEFVIISRNLKQYDVILENKENLGNIIEI